MLCHARCFVSETSKRTHSLERAVRAASDAAIHTDKLYAISGFALVHKVTIKNHVRRAGKLPSRRALRHFLYTDPLVVPEFARTVLHPERAAFVILLWRDRRCRRKVGCGCGRVSILAGVEETGIGAEVDRLEHFRADERTTGDNALKRDHLAQLGCSEMARTDMMVAKGAAEADTIGLAFDFVLLAVVYAFDNFGERVFKCREIVHRLLEQPVCEIASIVSQVVNIDDETALIVAEHASNIIAVVVDGSFGVEELLEHTRSILHQVSGSDGVVEKRHGGEKKQGARRRVWPRLQLTRPSA